MPLQWLPLAPDVWERDVLPRRVEGYRPAWLDELCASGELVWVGTEGGRVALVYRDEAPLLGPPPGAAAAAAGRGCTRRSARCSRRSRASSRELVHRDRACRTPS